MQTFSLVAGVGPDMSNLKGIGNLRILWQYSKSGNVKKMKTEHTVLILAVYLWGNEREVSRPSQ